MEYEKQQLLIKKTTRILGENTEQMRLMHVIDRLVTRVEELEAEVKHPVRQLPPIPQESPFVELDRKAKYMDIDD